MRITAVSDPIIQNYIDAGKARGASEALLSRLADAAWPSAKSEEFRYAGLAPLRKRAFPVAKDADAGAAALDSIFANSYFVAVTNGAHAAMPQESPEGLDVNWQATAAADDAPHAIALINRVMTPQGLAITAHQGQHALEILHHSSDGGQASFGRHTVTVATGAELTLLERYEGDGEYWQNQHLDIRLAAGARLTHIRLLKEGTAAIHTCSARAELAAESRYHQFTLAASGLETRFESEAILQGAGAELQADGVLLADDKKRHEINSYVAHMAADAVSNQVVRAVGRQSGMTTFQGKIHVADGAQKTQADQSTRSILLDRSAQANARPELEIFADDVKCSHGATVGELDENALFYLESRGVDPLRARQMLIQAFAGDALVALEKSPLLTPIAEQIDNWMSSNHA